MPYISHALRIKAIALQINIGVQLPLDQFKGFSQQLSDGIRRHSLLIGKKPKTQFITMVKVSGKRRYFYH